MRRTITAAAAAALTLGLVAGPAAAEKPDNGLSTVETVVAVSGASGYDENGSDFDILREAVLATGANTILDGGTFTVFAPTDAAFVALADALNGPDPTPSEEEAFGIVASLGIPAVTDVLLYHVAPDVVSRSEIARKSVDIGVASGPALQTQGDMIEAVGSSAQLLEPGNGITTTGGKIYVIDSVLLPF